MVSAQPAAGSGGDQSVSTILTSLNFIQWGAERTVNERLLERSCAARAHNVPSSPVCVVGEHSQVAYVAPVGQRVQRKPHKVRSGSYCPPTPPPPPLQKLARQHLYDNINTVSTRSCHVRLSLTNEGIQP